MLDFCCSTSAVLSNETVTDKIKSAFPGAQTADAVAAKLDIILSRHGYKNSTTLLATSFCSDEVNRELEDVLKKNFGSNFSMGGLAGFPFCGATSFGAMAHHIPTGGSCIIAYAPHVGIDTDGNVGKINRRGRGASGACCDAACAALAHIKAVRSGESTEQETPDDYLDCQQQWIQKLMLKYGDQLEASDDEMVELPHAILDCQNGYMKRIVEAMSKEVAGDGKIALLGGIQINTPLGIDEYFLPKKFQLLNRDGEVVIDLLEELTA